MADGRFLLNSGAALADRTGLVFTTEDESLLRSGDPQTALSSKYPVQVDRGGPATPI